MRYEKLKNLLLFNLMKKYTDLTFQNNEAILYTNEATMNSSEIKF